MPQNAPKYGLKAQGNGNSYPVLEFAREQPDLAAVLSKLIDDPNRRGAIVRDEKGNRKIQRPEQQQFRQIVDSISSRNYDNKIVMDLLPDLRLAANILVSCIMAPKDMVTTELTFGTLMSDLIPTSMLATLTSSTSDYFEKDHKIKRLLPKILMESLFEKGSKPIAVIPENSIDDAINNFGVVSFESFRDHYDVRNGEMVPMDLLGVPDYITRGRNKTDEKFLNFSLESSNQASLEDRNKIARHRQSKIHFSKLIPEARLTKDHDILVNVTDNYSVLKMRDVQTKVRNHHVRKIITQSSKGQFGLVSGLESEVKKMQSHLNLSDDKIEKMLFKDRQIQSVPTRSLKTNEQLGRTSIGNPLILELPNEAVIPVHVPGDPSHHIGYFIMIDEEGNPISIKPRDQRYKDLANQMNAKGNFASAMIKRSEEIFGGFDCNNNSHLDYSVRAFGDMVEKDLLERLKNGVYTNGVSIARNEDVYQLMLSRSLKGTKTQLLWIPIELMTYFAFDYNPDGIGKSLLDDIRVITSMRLMMMVAGVNAAMKNSVGQTKVSIKMDEDDPDASKSIEEIMDEIVKSKASPLPFGVNNLYEISHQLQKSAFMFEIQGHPGIPDAAIDFQQTQSNYNRPDQDLIDDLKNHSIQHTGVTTEMVDSGFESEFATSVAKNNLLLAKRVTVYQEEFTPQLEDFFRKIGMNSRKLVDILRKIVENNFDDVKKDTLIDYFQIDNEASIPQMKNFIVEYIVTLYLTNMTVRLPSPNTVTLTNQFEAFREYSEALEDAVQAYLGDAVFAANINGDTLSSEISVLRDMVIGYYKRRWLTENGMMTELSELFMKEGGSKSTGNTTWDEIKQYAEVSGLMTSEFLKNITPHVKTINKKLEQIDADSNYDGGGDSSSSDDGGLDDLGGDPPEDDFSLSEETPEPEDETESEEGPEEDTTTSTTTSTTDDGGGDDTAV